MIINGYGNDEMSDNLDWIYYRIDLMRLRNNVYLSSLSISSVNRGIGKLVMNLILVAKELIC